MIDPRVTFAAAPRPADGGTGGGAAGAIQIRLAPDGFPGNGATLAGADRPNPRLISNLVFDQRDGTGALIDKPNAMEASSLLWVFGQFLDHDLSQTRNGAAFGTASIAVPAGDTVFTPGSTLGFNRSAFAPGTGTSAANPRQYQNDITAFVDGSNIYGSSQAKLSALLAPGTAKLLLDANGLIAFDRNLGGGIGNGAATGDDRASENPALLGMHALFAREHNRTVDALNAAAAAEGVTLTVAQQFEGARARVEAIMQAIVYNEFLPALVGPDPLPAYTGFRSTVNPAISLEFSTAIYRLGHTLLSPTIARMEENGATHSAGNLALRDAFGGQARGALAQTGVEAILRGMSTTRSQAYDTYMVEDVRSLLFGQGGPGTDLAALNIQRGRDHGLPSYAEMRAALGLAPKTSFAQITSDPEIAARLQAAYGQVSRLDLWVGVLAETPVPGGLVGETARAVLIDQFLRLRDGDPFFSLGRGFGTDELAELWSTRLSDVIVRNTNVTDLQGDAFVAYARITGGPGNDALTGGQGHNLLIGNAGNDMLTGGPLADHIVGGAGDDRLRGRPGDDAMFGGAGDDEITGGQGNDILDGGPGVDVLSGNSGDDVIVIRGAEAAFDTMRGGGTGVDTIRVDPSSGAVTLAGTGRIVSIERLEGNGGSILGTGAADLFDFSGFTSVTGVASIRGQGGADRIVGSPHADAIVGGGGNDVLSGAGGNDRLTGGTGEDTFLFLRGRDAGVNRITDFDASGNDVIRLEGFSLGGNTAARLAAVQAATTIAGGVATIDLGDLGGAGSIVIDGAQRLSFTTEDFLFG